MKISSTFLYAFSIALLSSCGNSDKKEVTQRVMPFPTVKVIQTSAESFTSYPASVEGLVNSQVRAKIPGYILDVLVDEGRQVKKGQLLFRLETQSLTQDAGAAKARINVAQVEVDKLAPLVEKEIISKVQLETAKANLEQAKSAYQSVAANIDYANIKSPVDGVVGSIPYRKGNLVSPSDPLPLTTVSSIEKVYVYFAMNEKDVIGFLKSLDGSSLDEKAKNIPPVQLVLADGSSYEETGKIESITGGVNPSTGTVNFRATFNNPKGYLRNGSSATIKLPKKYSNVLAIPSMSTFEQQGKKLVYLVNGDSLVLKSITEIAEVNGLSIIEGLAEGDQILAKGLGKARSGMKIIPQPTSIDSITNSFQTVFK